MKQLCFKNNIPTARFKICNKLEQVIKFMKSCNFPVVVKADGLAAGKGVTICKNKDQVIDISSKILNGIFKSSKTVILEEFLEGEEASYFLIINKNHYKFFGSAQDHKQVYENDKGPNTGGMGAYSPAPIITNNLEKKIIERIVKPTLSALKKKKKFYNGFLYVGLMIKKNEPYLIEYNIRMGDPECQVILPRLKTDLLKVIKSVTENKLKKINIKWKSDKCMTIVLCAKGYPNKYKKNIQLINIEKTKLSKKDFIYHAGTKFSNGKLLSSGGRVLNVTSVGRNFKNIRSRIIYLLDKLKWNHGFYRKDIGWKVINKKNAHN